jgi:hypothetical protein
MGFLLGAVALSACKRQRESPVADPGPEPVGEAVAPVERDRDDESARMAPASRIRSATESIAEARCAREQRCNNVGADKDYSSMNDCMARVRNDWKDDLNARECPGGVDQKELNECLAEIRNEDCGNPFDSLGRVAACSAAQICEADERERDVTK